MDSERRRNSAPKGLIFNIQKFSLHDGPGIRTVVFLKGCPLACMWCSNPEGRDRSPELLYNPERCIGCHECDLCISVCLEHAITSDERGKVRIDRSRCDGCGDCAHVCPSHALQGSGQWLGVEDVLRVVEEDDLFYARSGGGITLSGGEPLAQGAFVRALLEAARQRGIDTAIETSGLCNWKILSGVAPLADRIFFDIKCFDPEKHERVTGVPNRQILENFRRMRAEFPALEVIVRTPIIPGINDSDEDIQAIRAFVQQAGGASRYELLPYHGFGGPKYDKLGKHYRLSRIQPPTAKRMRELQSAAALLS